jgi:hypothetical protein
LDYSPLLAAGRKSNLIKILSKEKVRCFRPLGLKEKFRNTLQPAAGIEILAFRSSATSSRHVKSFHDFILYRCQIRREKAISLATISGPVLLYAYFLNSLFAEDFF